MTEAPPGYRFTAGLVRLAYGLARWRIDARGYERVPTEGGAILTWNHTSHVDFAVTVVPMLRRTGRWVRFLALRELWDSRLLGWVPRLAHCVPVERGSADGRVEAFRHAVTALQQGDLVMVAPEGTISESFELLPFRTGPVRMAQAAGVPIVPTASWGTHRFVTTGHTPSVRRAWRLPVTVRVGEPLHVAPDEDPAAATARLRGATQALLDEARADFPLGAPKDAWWVPAAMGGGAPPVDEVLARYRPGQALTDSRWGRREQRGGNHQRPDSEHRTPSTPGAGVPRYRPPRDHAVPAAGTVYRMAAWIAFRTMDVQRWQFDLRGVEHLPARGGAVIAANHIGFWDFFTVGRAAYYGLGRPVRILAKDTLFEVPVFGRLMHAARHIPVHRAEGAGALHSAVEALQAGELVLVLPEQTISPSFELLPFKTGAARMAAAAGVPIVPAASWGSHRFHTVLHRPQPHWRLPVSVAYGEPVHPAPDSDPEEVTEVVRDRVRVLADDLVTTYPDGMPAGAWWVPERHGGGAPTPAQGDAYVERIRRTRFGRPEQRAG